MANCLSFVCVRVCGCVWVCVGVCGCVSVCSGVCVWVKAGRGRGSTRKIVLHSKRTSHLHVTVSVQKMDLSIIQTLQKHPVYKSSGFLALRTSLDRLYNTYKDLYYTNGEG